MYSTLATLLDRLDSSVLEGTSVIQWGSPVVSFGDLANARIATLGLNPSNREFMNNDGEELQGVARRFQTLHSLGLKSWSEADVRHLDLIIESCRKYFQGNPYNKWFKKLDNVISGTNTSYYGSSYGACHLDLIPFATKQKWGAIPKHERSALLDVSGDTLGLLLRDSPVKILILNGSAVVQQFQDISGIRLEARKMSTWSLPRRSRSDVSGISYIGEVSTLSGVVLNHKLRVLGFNHNIQSSFGVTTEVVQAIRSWLSTVVKEEWYATPRSSAS